MAIVRYADPADPPTADADWTSINNQIELLFLAINLPFRVDYAANLVKKGATFYISGTKYLCDADTSITGTASPYVKLLPSGDGSSVTASYVASLTGVTWSTTYNGYYDAGTPASMYYFDEHLAMAAGVITVCRTERNTNFYNHSRINIGVDNTSSNANSIVIGVDNIASGSYSKAIGADNSATGTNGLSIGTNCTASATSSFSIGESCVSSGSTSLSIGKSSQATGASSIAIGSSAGGKNTGAIAIGSGSQATGSSSISIGVSNTADTTNEVAIGSLRYVEFASTASEDTVFDKLYGLLGSVSTVREIGAIGSFGDDAITQIDIDSASIITISGNGVPKAINNGTLTAIGSKLKLFFITGSSL